MKVLATTNKGLEGTALLEIKELLNVKASPLERGVVFAVKKFEELFLLSYKSQSLRKIILLLDSFGFKKLDDADKRISKIGLDEWVGKDFAVRALIVGNQLDRSEVEAKIGGFVLKNVNAKVNLEDPATTFFVYILGNKLFFGIDFAVEDMGKRDYRIFSTREIIKSNVAYALVRKAGFKSETLLDVFCLSGTIAIEAALYASNISPSFFNKNKFFFLKLPKFKNFNFKKFFERIDKKNLAEIKGKIIATDALFHNINAAKKNAKIAGINKLISFSKLDVEWLDTKFDKESVDCIASYPPHPTRINTKSIKRLYQEFFHNADFVLKHKGKIVLMVEKENSLIKDLANEHNFKIVLEESVWQGKKEFSILIFSKKTYVESSFASARLSAS